MKRQIHILATGLVTAALAIFLPMANAQTACPPSDGSGDAINCRMGTLLNKNANLLTTLGAHTASCDSTEPHCAALQRHLARAQNAQARAMNAHNHTGADNYHQLTLSPQYHRNSNRKGGGGVQASPNSDTVDTNYDPTVGQGITDGLDDANNALDDATSNLENLPSPTLPPFPTVGVYDFTTDPAYPAWLHGTIDEKVWIPALFAMKVAARALEIVDVGAEHGCLETLVALGEGGNGSLGCLALALAVATLDYEVDWMEFVDRDLLYWNAKGAYLNAQNAVTVGNSAGQVITGVGDDVKDVRVKVDGVAVYIDHTLTPDLNQILANQAIIMQLLSTPQGQRPAFPVK